VTHKKKVLVVAAHPDDEILGCGGTMALHVDKGNDVYVVFMADGVASRGDSKNLLGKINERKQSAIEACAIIGCKHPVFLGFPDNQLDACSILDITQKLESVIDEINPEIVYTHHNKDLNVDHQLTHQAVITACRPQPDNTVSEIYSFEVLSSTGWNSPTENNIFIPNTFVEISKTWKKKMDALYCYDDELRSYPHARSYKGVKSLAVFRGISVGLEYAEAFHLIRKLHK
jgi:LmbE family N-acetylglucosaminyl deacetylase